MRVFKKFSIMITRGISSNYQLKKALRGKKPYPILTKQRNIDKEEFIEDTSNFENISYENINRARLDHLEQMDLPINGKSVLDVGAGIGDMAPFFLKNNCTVHCLDARPGNVERNREKHPEVKADIADVETTPLEQFGQFDIVFCYGLLYHLENPILALRNMKSVCKEILMVSTIICDHYLPVMVLTDERLASTQALQGMGCRPSPSFLAMALDRIGFPYIYSPTFMPDHHEFQYDWYANLDWQGGNGDPIRAIFIASMKKIESSNLIPLHT